MGKTFPLLQLPLELREQIYAHYFDPTTHLDTGGCDGGGRYDFDFALYRASKQIYLEAQTMFRRENVFVRIETPWPTAGMYSGYMTRMRQMIGRLPRFAFLTAEHDPKAFSIERYDRILTRALEF